MVVRGLGLACLCRHALLVLLDEHQGGGEHASACDANDLFNTLPLMTRAAMRELGLAKNANDLVASTTVDKLVAQLEVEPGLLQAVGAAIEAAATARAGLLAVRRRRSSSTGSLRPPSTATTGRRAALAFMLSTRERTRLRAWAILLSGNAMATRVFGVLCQLLQPMRL